MMRRHKIEMMPICFKPFFIFIERISLDFKMKKAVFYLSLVNMMGFILCGKYLNCFFFSRCIAMFEVPWFLKVLTFEIGLQSDHVQEGG